MTEFQIDLKAYKSLFVVKPSSLGDIIHTLPVIDLIRKHAPHLIIRWICNPEWKPLLEDYPEINEIIEFPRKQFRGLKTIDNAIKFAKFLRSLPKEQPELTIDFQGLLRSALICKARKSKTVIGFSDSREGARFAHQHIVQVSSSMHAVDRYLSVLPHLGIPFRAEDIHFPLDSHAELSRFCLPQSYVLLHPYSRGQGKSMNQQSILDFCQRLAPFPVVLVGVNYRHLAIKEPHILDLVNQTNLAELINLSKTATACVSVDSGPMHIAAAVNPKTIGIHNWSQPSKVGPYSDEARVWKAGFIAPRKQFSAAEDQQEQDFQVKDVRTLVSFLQENWL